MPQTTLFDRAGKNVGSVELSDELFAAPVNAAVLHQVVTAQLAGRRIGTHDTKTRGEVRGGGAKPYRQKGTGRARQGSTNAPHYRGGGTVFGPHPRSYEQRLPRRGHDQHATRRLEGAEHRDEVLGPDGLEAERVDHLDRLVAELGGERAAQGEPLHAARQALLVGARVRPEDRAAAAIVRRSDAALAGATGALLAIRLLAATGDFAAGLRRVRADALRSELGGHDLVEDGNVHRRVEELGIELDVAERLAGLVVEGGRWHRARPS